MFGPLYKYIYIYAELGGRLHMPLPYPFNPYKARTQRKPEM